MLTLIISFLPSTKESFSFLIERRLSEWTWIFVNKKYVIENYIYVNGYPYFQSIERVSFLSRLWGFDNGNFERILNLIVKNWISVNRYWFFNGNRNVIMDIVIFAVGNSVFLAAKMFC